MIKSEKMVEVEEKYDEDIVEILHRLYVSGGLGVAKVAEELNIGKTTARSWLIKSGIELRSLSEAKKVAYSKMSKEERTEQTRKAKEKVNYLRETGQLRIDHSHLTGPNALSRRPEVRRKNSEFHRNWKDRPKKSVESLAKMRKSMEKVLRERATEQELLMKEALEAAGHEPIFQHTVGRAILDFAFIDIKVGIEIDGIFHVTNTQRREKDVERAKELEDAGWIVLRFMNHEVENNIEGCLMIVEAVLKGRGVVIT